MKSVRRLSRRRSARHDQNRYLIDGPVLLRDAIAAGVRLETVYVESDAVESSLLGTVPAGVAIREVRPGTLAKVLDVVTPNRIVSVAVMDRVPLERVLDAAEHDGLPVLVLVDVADPGNVGTLIRAAEAAGCSGVVITGATADPYAPKTVRSAAGSSFRVPLVLAADPTEVLSSVRGRGIDTMAAVMAAGAAPEDLDLGGAFALVMGNEAHGLPDSVVAGCSSTVSVPMAGAVESLNVAMAATVVLFEASRQRRSRAADGGI